MLHYYHCCVTCSITISVIEQIEKPASATPLNPHLIFVTVPVCYRKNYPHEKQLHEDLVIMLIIGKLNVNTMDWDKNI